MNRLFLFSVLILGSAFHILQGQNALLISSSPRSNGLGKTNLNFTDLHSLFGNQAGLARVEELSAMAYVEQRFLLSDLNQAAIGVALPTFSGVFGLTLRNFGTADYQENEIGLAYGRTLSEKFRIGGQLHWSQINIAEYGSRALFNFDFGIQAELLPNLWAAAHARKVIRQRILDQEYAGLLSVGLGYRVSDKVSLLAELVKDIDFPADLRFGIEYNPTKAIFLRGGFNTAPGGWSFGFGLPILNNLTFDCAAAYHPYLGFTPSTGIAYRKRNDF